MIARRGADVDKLRALLGEHFGQIGVSVCDGEFFRKFINAFGVEVDRRNNLGAVGQRFEAIHVRRSDAARANDCNAGFLRHRSMVGQKMGLCKGVF